jgi:signal transduction histidine kinase
LQEYVQEENVDDTEYREMYASEKSNVFFTAKDSAGNIIADYGSKDAYRISYEYEEFFKSPAYEKNEIKIFETFADAEQYLEVLEKDNYISEWTFAESSGELNVTYYSRDAITYTVNAYIRKDFTASDRYYYTLRAVDFVVAMRYWIILIAVVSALLCLSLLSLLCFTAGRKVSGELKLSLLDRVPLDIFWAACACFIPLMLILLHESSIGDEYAWFTVALFIIISTVCALLLIACIVTLAARVKLGEWYKNTVIYRASGIVKKFLRLIWQGIKFLIKRIPLFWQALTALLLLRAIEFVCLKSSPDFYVLFWILEGILLVAALIYIVIALRKLQKAAKEIASGNLDYRAELSGMLPALREHGENLNNIGEGLQTALAEKIKSEHMKAELITNVSHDIKTPLTSIVTYVDLLKKEGLDSENAAEYLTVLERQSGKLKKLTEDLIEASKATTGCISVNSEEMDINVLIAQACGEYEDKLMQNNLTSVMTLAEENPRIFADGGLVWRVFDNLFNNICKYSQKNTRVYLKTEVKEEKVYITFSNISSAQLDITSEELMERFVRGDASRSTEGSGLGLSIAKSLIELQNGSFDIKIDGDLFKVQIVFDIIK